MSSVQPSRDHPDVESQSSFDLGVQILLFDKFSQLFSGSKLGGANAAKISECLRSPDSFLLALQRGEISKDQVVKWTELASKLGAMDSTQAAVVSAIVQSEVWRKKKSWQEITVSEIASVVLQSQTSRKEVLFGFVSTILRDDAPQSVDKEKVKTLLTLKVGFTPDLASATVETCDWLFDRKRVYWHMASLVGHSMLIFLFTAFMFARLGGFAFMSSPFVGLLSPLLIVYFLRLFRGFELYRSAEHPTRDFFIPTFISLSNLLFYLLVALQLDKHIHAHWGVLFVPMYAVAVLHVFRTYAFEKSDLTGKDKKSILGAFAAQSESNPDVYRVLKSVAWNWWATVLFYEAMFFAFVVMIGWKLQGSWFTWGTALFPLRSTADTLVLTYVMVAALIVWAVVIARRQWNNPVTPLFANVKRRLAFLEDCGIQLPKKQLIALLSVIAFLATVFVVCSEVSIAGLTEAIINYTDHGVDLDSKKGPLFMLFCSLWVMLCTAILFILTFDGALLYARYRLHDFVEKHSAQRTAQNRRYLSNVFDIF